MLCSNQAMNVCIDFVMGAWECLASIETGFWRPKFVRINIWRPRQIVAISQSTIWNAFAWMKMCEFRLRFH